MNSTKNVWRLKKYTRSEQQFQQQQTEFQELEFSTKPQNPQSIRRPNNQKKKPGETQEFVFVDLSPKKKASPVNNDQPHKERLIPSQFSTLDLEQKKRTPTSRVARLFRSSSSGNNTLEKLPLSALKPSLHLNEPSLRSNVPQQLLSSPTIVQHVTHSAPVSTATSSLQLSAFSDSASRYQSTSSTKSESSSLTAYSPNVVPQLKRSFTCGVETGRPVSPSRECENNRNRSTSSASISLNVSKSGQAFLDFGSFNPSKTNDLSRSNSRRMSPAPSPQKALSPVFTNDQKFPLLQHGINNHSEQYLSSNSENECTDCESADSDSDEDDSDAFKAFSKVVRRNTNGGRKRTNTVSSISSCNNVVKPTGLVRQHSITSISSIKYGRNSPTRLRQNTMNKPPALNLSIYNQHPASVQSFPDLPHSANSLHTPHEQFDFFEDINAKVQPSANRHKPYLHSKNLSVSNFPTPSATPTAAVSSETLEKKPSLLQPSMDMDRFMDLDLLNDGLQSPGMFEMTGEPKYDMMGNVTGTFSVPFPAGLNMDLADELIFDEFINYDSTIGNEVN